MPDFVWRLFLVTVLGASPFGILPHQEFLHDLPFMADRQPAFAVTLHGALPFAIHGSPEKRACDAIHGIA